MERNSKTNTFYSLIWDLCVDASGMNQQYMLSIPLYGIKRPPQNAHQKEHYLSIPLYGIGSVSW